MDNFDKDFSNVFDGIKKTMNAIDGELDLLKQINAEKKEELQKAKRFNIFMLIIAIISLAVTIVGLIVSFSVKQNSIYVTNAPPLGNNTNPDDKLEFVLFFSNEYFGIITIFAVGGGKISWVATLTDSPFFTYRFYGRYDKRQND